MIKKRKTLEEKICEKYFTDEQTLQILQDNTTRISSTELLSLKHINNFGVIAFEWLIKEWIFGIIEVAGLRPLDFENLRKEVTKRCKPILEKYLDSKGLEENPKLPL